jgi:hypothetical protein
VNRRTQRMRRRLHRRDVRGEPLTLLVDDRYPGQTRKALIHAIYRYRSELAPLVLGAATGLTAAFLHAWVPGWAPLVALLALAGSAALWGVQRLTPGLRRIPRASHHRTQILRIIGDPHRLQMLTTLGHPHQHRPAPMQIHPHDLLTRIHFTHRGLLRCGSEHPESASGRHGERRPRSFIASECE